MVKRSTVARMIVLLVALPACDRFAHPKYDPPQYAPASPGGVGGGAHTTQEWYRPEGRDLGLKRIFLTLLLLLRESSGGAGK